MSLQSEAFTPLYETNTRAEQQRLNSNGKIQCLSEM